MYLNTLTKLDLLTKDTQSLQTRLAVWPDNSQMGIEYQLSLIGLYQRATGGLDGVQIQLAEPTIVEVRTVAEAKASLDALIVSLDTQRVELQANLEQLKQDITTATLALESANYQWTQLTTERDLALNAYQALSAQQEETRIDLARNDLIAKVASQALPTRSPIPNRTLVKTVIAGALAFALACFGVLLVNWWKSSVPAKSLPAN
jgi:capsule polysaccharide export protein KpsE/RkpR